MFFKGKYDEARIDFLLLMMKTQAEARRMRRRRNIAP
jgi:hypothetical protein